VLVRNCKSHIFFFQAEDGIRDFHVTGVQTCALPIFKLSCGDIIFLADQDDVWRIDKVEKSLKLLMHHDLLVSDCIITDVSLKTRSEERRVGKECRYRRMMYR